VRPVGFFDRAWAQAWVERFFAHPGPTPFGTVKQKLLADLLCYEDHRISAARLAFLVLELHHNWTPQQMEHVVHFVYCNAMRLPGGVNAKVPRKGPGRRATANTGKE
jgi:hypothetical protein